jgi:hypothetical protein
MSVGETFPTEESQYKAARSSQGQEEKEEGEFPVRLLYRKLMKEGHWYYC